MNTRPLKSVRPELDPGAQHLRLTVQRKSRSWK